MTMTGLVVAIFTLIFVVFVVSTVFALCLAAVLEVVGWVFKVKERLDKWCDNGKEGER